MASDPMTLCPQCGAGVSVDEDGCCVSCGCVAAGPGIMVALDAARAEERERCAAVCERVAGGPSGGFRDIGAEQCAAAIRGRG
jgi:hypothetical protein